MLTGAEWILILTKLFKKKIDNPKAAQYNIPDSFHLIISTYKYTIQSL